MAVTFEQAVSVATLWIESWEKGEISDEVLADRVSDLVSTKDGVRGFFVVSMAGDSSLLDRLPESLVIQLRQAGEPVVDITVKNLAMSSAMAIIHQREFNQQKQEGSERVTARCIDLLQFLEPKTVKERLEQLLEGIEGKGDDALFLERWNYDLEQKMAISYNVNLVAKL